MDIPRKGKEKMSKYTDKMIADMREVGSFSYDSAKSFAESNGLTLRSVIAKVRALELDYQPKDPKVTKSTGPKAPAKSDIVTGITSELRIDLPSLSKMTVVDLLALRAAIASVEA